jgi:hypothetical protein
MLKGHFVPLGNIAPGLYSEKSFSLFSFVVFLSVIADIFYLTTLYPKPLGLSFYYGIASMC